jgi:hypothetical protein
MTRLSRRDLRRGRDVLIRRGTPGVIKQVFWILYTVEFRLVDDVDTLVTIRGLRNRDLTPNQALPVMPTQPDRRDLTARWVTQLVDEARHGGDSDPPSPAGGGPSATQLRHERRSTEAAQSRMKRSPFACRSTVPRGRGPFREHQPDRIQCRDHCSAALAADGPRIPDGRVEGRFSLLRLLSKM